MGFNWNGNNVTSLNWNGNPVTTLNYNGVQVWTAGPVVIPPFYIENVSQATNDVQLKKSSSDAPTVSLEYSTDNQSTWSTVVYDTSIVLQAGGKVFFRTPSGVTNNTFASGVNYYNYFSTNSSCDIGGDITTLLTNSGGVDDISSYGYHTFLKLFYGNIYIKSAGNLRLPQTTLNLRCFMGMFDGCTALTTAPNLPALTLSSGCYSNMFLECSSLVNVPSTLPATYLYSEVYNGMFEGCTSLVTPPEIMATNFMETSALASMFRRCSSLTSIKIHTTSFGSYGYGNWVNRVSSSGTFYCPSALGDNETITRDNSHCPSNWTVVNI